MTDHLRTWLEEPREHAPCTIIAEVAQAHDGSLGMAHAFIDAAARAGADAIKFQTHIADAESTLAEPWRKPFSSQDGTRLDYWRRMEFSEEAWCELRRHAADKNLMFLSSPFSPAAVELLTRVGVAGWKVASGEISNHALLDQMADTGLPMMLSTGMSDDDEIGSAVARLQERDVRLAVLQCTSMYPCPPEWVGLNLIPEFRRRYGCAVGLSDHSATIYAGLAAATLGIEVLEVHLTLSRELFGPDVVASVTTDELRQLAEGVRFIERMRDSAHCKSDLPESVTSLRQIFTKSVVVLENLPAGATLRADQLAAKKPGTGIPANELGSVVGRRLRRAVAADAVLQPDDLE